MADPLPLSVQGLGRRYARSRPWAVQDVMLTFPPGTITALVGPNGAGKSTLIRACLGFERPDAGRVLVFGHDPTRDRARAVSAIGYVPQASGLYQGLSIDDHFTLAATARNSFDRTFAVTSASRAGLSPERRIRELSGGERAKVSLILALATRANLLLLDEPLANLDPLSRREFLSLLLDDSHGRGGTVVLASHVVADVEHACDRLVVLSGGSVALECEIAFAKRSYGVVVVNGGGVPEMIGSFESTDGEVLALVPPGAGTRAASLEEVVLGHLAFRRGSQRAEPA